MITLFVLGWAACSILTFILLIKSFKMIFDEVDCGDIIFAAFVSLLGYLGFCAALVVYFLESVDNKEFNSPLCEKFTNWVNKGIK